MSINWSFKSEDLDEIISKLEKDITLKKKEIKISESIFNQLLGKSKNVKDEIRNLNSKLIFAEKEIHRLSQELENSYSNINYVRTEINQINQLIQEKELEINRSISIKEKIKQKHTLIENEIKKKNDFNLDRFFNQFKKILYQKGFITTQEFEDLKINCKN